LSCLSTNTRKNTKKKPSSIKNPYIERSCKKITKMGPAGAGMQKGKNTQMLIRQEVDMERWVT